MTAARLATTLLQAALVLSAFVCVVWCVRDERSLSRRLGGSPPHEPDDRPTLADESDDAPAPSFGARGPGPCTCASDPELTCAPCLVERWSR